MYRDHKHTVGAAALRCDRIGFWVASGDANLVSSAVWAWDNPRTYPQSPEVQVFRGRCIANRRNGTARKQEDRGRGCEKAANVKTKKCVMWDTGNAVGEMVGHQKTVL